MVEDLKAHYDQLRNERMQRLMATDEQYRQCAPLPAIEQAKRQPGLRLGQVVQLVMEGYAERPAMGQRMTELVTDPATGRNTVRLLPTFETITYRDLWAQSRMIASDWHFHPSPRLDPGSFICILGFVSPDYVRLVLAAIHLGCVFVPLQTNSQIAQHKHIINETEPTILAVGIDYIEHAVDVMLAGAIAPRILLFDHDPRDDAQRERLKHARRRLADGRCSTPIETLNDTMARAATLPEPPLFVPAPDENPLTLLFYTSGSTGDPKGVMYPERNAISNWLVDTRIPAITLNYAPMSHSMGTGVVMTTLANGGIAYCLPKSDLSTLFEDLSLTRPTLTYLVPRICELFHHQYVSDVQRRVDAGENRASAETEAKRHLREDVFGGRLLAVGCGSASLAQDTQDFAEAMLETHIDIGYTSTEVGKLTLIDWKVQRDIVIDYKLIDVPESGYFTTDKPYPRGELLVKTRQIMPGYYKQPELTRQKFDEEGFYKTGDVMVELGPDHLVYIDRSNNVVKLAQGEFIAVANLEALYGHHPLLEHVYLHAESDRAYLLAVVVPSEEVRAELARHPDSHGEIKARIRAALKQTAAEAQLSSYEIPRDFIIETSTFTLENRMLTEIGKLQRPNAARAYGERLAAMYDAIDQEQRDELGAVRAMAADRPVIDTIIHAVQATIGIPQEEIAPDSRFTELGGDSLSALSFSVLLEEIFGFEVPVGVIIDPVADLARVAAWVEKHRAGADIPRFASVHGADSTTILAQDLKLDRFIQPALIAAARALPGPAERIATVLVTGATGFLGRFQALAWLERMAQTGGTVICIARGRNNAEARQRIEDAIATDPALLARFRELATGHLEVIAGDIGDPGLGLDLHTWDDLAARVDTIVHAAAHVNHLLSYNQLFAANVAGTAELVRLAITTRRKRVHYVSTVGVSMLDGKPVAEDADIRSAIPACTANDDYAKGYVISKWASEVLLREAHDHCGLPVLVFRPAMILAHSHFAGQLNVPDMFTRLLLSLIATGIAPPTFHGADARHGRPKGHYAGLPVDFLADSITAIGAANADARFAAFNLIRAGEGASLDDFVDWLIDLGCEITRLDSYAEWLARFETAMLALPEDQRRSSLLTLMQPYAQPLPATPASPIPSAGYHAAAAGAGLEIPGLTAALIDKYLSDFRHLGLLAAPAKAIPAQ